MTSRLGRVIILAEAEPDDPPSELSENLPAADVYVLCSASGARPLVCYASRGFKDLFEVSAYQELSGGKHNLGDQAVVAALASSVLLSCADLKAGLCWLEARMAAVAGKVVAGERLMQRDLAWVVRFTRTGQPIVCEVTLVLHRTEESGEDLLVAMYEDVSAQVPLRKLLHAAASGAGRSFTASLKDRAMEYVYFRGPLLSSVADAASTEDSVPGRAGPQVLQEALLECSHGPVGVKLSKGGIVGLEVPSGGAAAPPSQGADMGEYLAALTAMPGKLDQAASSASAHLILRKAATRSWGAALWA